ncbi:MULTISPECIES: hypothetical protein [unclassified Cyanobium]|uniref:hypothetical protein n=1 Tax=unclassified Cyanobium TaxID=2627006 RepID=UPI0020CF8980|nr:MULTISPECIES: hypothetical protein [unclassified Cyanobium]MCP9833630.1 hypothetical protein [Cyanobium sp. La Preciosa 7G6]
MKALLDRFGLAMDLRLQQHPDGARRAMDLAGNPPPQALGCGSGRIFHPIFPGYVKFVMIRIHGRITTSSKKPPPMGGGLKKV